MSESQENIDNIYMQRCLQLAVLGLGSVSTNPLVGCVIVFNNKIIGEGYHQQYGKAHAEVNAINNVADKSLLSKSTLYVNLEPCSHHGKTPPCADLLIQHNIQRVVISTIDTFSEVAGRGIEKLKKAGIDLCVGVLNPRGREVNKRFFTFNEKKRPYIILKWAETADGFLGRDNNDTALDKRISNSYTDIKVHGWRAREDAILVGTNTGLSDNPSLTTRLVDGKNAVRVLIDYDLKVPPTHQLYNNEAKTIIINNKVEKNIGNIVYEKVSDKTLEAVLAKLYTHKIQAVIIEGGAKLLQSFISKNLWDEARVITSDKVWGKGVSAPIIRGSIVEQERIENDTITTYTKM